MSDKQHFGWLTFSGYDYFFNKYSIFIEDLMLSLVNDTHLGKACLELLLKTFYSYTMDEEYSLCFILNTGNPIECRRWITLRKQTMELGLGKPYLSHCFQLL